MSTIVLGHGIATNEVARLGARRSKGAVSKSKYAENTMATSSDFVSVTDEDISLNADSNNDHPLPAEVNGTPRSGEKAVLMWRIRTDGTSRSDYEVYVNGVRLGGFSVSYNNWHAMHEIFSGSVITSGSNEVEFKAVEGRLIFSDVVLFYRQDLPPGGAW